jgi:hypothetical protein
VACWLGWSILAGVAAGARLLGEKEAGRQDGPWLCCWSHPQCWLLLPWLPGCLPGWLQIDLDTIIMNPSLNIERFLDSRFDVVISEGE